jgi:hypothetical protein
MTPKINRRGQYLKTDISLTARLGADRYDKPQIKLSSHSAVSAQPSTEEESDRWVAQQMFDHYNG